MRWVTAQDLQLWTGRLDCEGTLPELVRRLVHSTIDAPDRVAFEFDSASRTTGPINARLEGMSLHVCAGCGRPGADLNYGPAIW